MANSKLNGWIWRVACLIIGIAFGAGVAWGVVNGRINEVCDKVADHEARIRVVEDRFARIETKLDYLIAESKEAP